MAGPEIVLMGSEDARLLLLSPSDNVVVARVRLGAGEAVSLGGASRVLAVDIGLGHKLACRPIAAGDKIIKYGAPIGVATAPIAVGEHVHVHNVRSDYTPTYHLTAERETAA